MSDAREPASAMADYFADILTSHAADALHEAGDDSLSLLSGEPIHTDHYARALTHSQGCGGKKDPAKCRLLVLGVKSGTLRTERSGGARGNRTPARAVKGRRAHQGLAPSVPPTGAPAQPAGSLRSGPFLEGVTYTSGRCSAPPPRGRTLSCLPLFSCHGASI